MTKKMKKAENYRLVPLINMDAVGGMDSSNEMTIYDPQYVIGMVPFIEAQDGDICIFVSGTSMVPSYSSGSKILLRKVINWQEYFGYGEVYCIVLTDGRRILKEVHKSNVNPKEYVLCVSHNKDVDPEELPRCMISSVWKVLATQRLEGY